MCRFAGVKRFEVSGFAFRSAGPEGGSSVEKRQEDLDQWTDEHRESDRADTEGASEEPAQHQDRDLDGGTGQPDRGSEFGDAGHEAVARPRAQPGADVEARSESDGQDARGQNRHSPSEWFGLGKNARADVDGEPDDDGVEDG